MFICLNVAAVLALKKMTGDPVVGLSHVALNSSSPLQRGQRLFWVSVDCKAVPRCSRVRTGSPKGLWHPLNRVLAGQKAGHPCPKTGLPTIGLRDNTQRHISCGAPLQKKQYGGVTVDR